MQRCDKINAQWPGKPAPIEALSPELKIAMLQQDLDQAENRQGRMEGFLDDHDGIVIDMADSYLMHQQIYIMQKYVDILTTRIVHDTTKEKAKQNE